MNLETERDVLWIFSETVHVRYERKAKKLFEAEDYSGI